MESNKPLGYILKRTFQIFKSQVTNEFKKKGFDMTFEQFVIMKMLNANCDMIQQDLADMLQKDKSIIVRQINCLLDDQYITRETNTEDKRKKNLIMTQKGKELLNQLKVISDGLSEKLLDGISDNEYEIFKKVMLKIQENAGAEEL